MFRAFEDEWPSLLFGVAAAESAMLSSSRRAASRLTWRGPTWRPHAPSDEHGPFRQRWPAEAQSLVAVVATLSKPPCKRAGRGRFANTPSSAHAPSCRR